MVIYENEYVTIKTIKNERFPASITNKTAGDISLVFPQTDDFNGCDKEPWTYNIPANGFLGIPYMEYDGNIKQALEQGDFTIKTTDETEEVRG